MDTPPEKITAENSTPPANDRHFTAFILDDNFHNRQIFRISLEAVEYEVTECEDSTEGMEILKQRSFDLLVLDLQMPKMNGQTVLNNVRQLPIHKNMYVVVVTANSHMATEGVTLESDYLLYKPIDVVQFARFVERLKQPPRTPRVSQ